VLEKLRSDLDTNLEKLTTRERLLNDQFDRWPSRATSTPSVRPALRWDSRATESSTCRIAVARLPA
jgi:hypothetical protein